MKTLCLAAALAAALFTPPAHAVVMTGASFEGLQFNQCLKSEKACVQVQASKADTSLQGTIMYMKNMEVNFVNRRSNKIVKSIKAERGYLDFSTRQLVLLQKNGASSTEDVYQLKDMSHKAYTTTGGTP
jgi:hypothetical protein